VRVTITLKNPIAARLFVAEVCRCYGLCVFVRCSRELVKLVIGQRAAWVIDYALDIERFRYRRCSVLRNATRTGESRNGGARAGRGGARISGAGTTASSQKEKCDCASRTCYHTVPHPKALSTGVLALLFHLHFDIFCRSRIMYRCMLEYIFDIFEIEHYVIFLNGLQS